MEVTIPSSYMGLLQEMAKKELKPELRSVEAQAAILVMEALDNRGRKGCRVPQCGKKTLVRGLCRRDHRTCVYHVGEGHVTWAWLEAYGKCLPAGKTEPPSREDVEGQNTVLHEKTASYHGRWLLGQSGWEALLKQDQKESRGSVQ